MAKLSVDKALLKAKFLIKKGEIGAAKKIYSTILNSYPKNIKAKEGLAALNTPRQSAATQSPPQTKMTELISLYNQRQLAAVIERAYTLTKQYPKVLELWNLLGAAAAQTGRLAQAVNAFQKVISIKPDDFQAHNNMGIALQRKGKTEEAINAYKKALVIKPNYAQAYNNMGNALQQQTNLGEAVKAYEKAILIKPDYAEAYNNMGNVLGEQINLEDAVKAYEKAILIKPDYAEAWTNGAEALENWNKLEQLALWLERAFQILEQVPSDIRFMKAKLLWRNKKTQEAIKLISNIDFETIKPIRKQSYLNLKAKCYDASKEYDLAYNCFKHMNSFAIKTDDYSRLDPESYFQNIREQLVSLKSDSLENQVNHITEQNDFVPVFLVGFPRSGTTLLDTILRSHSSIDVVEEQPLISLAEAFIKKSGFHEIGQALPQSVIYGARKAYRTELEKHQDHTGNKSILIDKLPLNLLQIPLIQKLYPRARYILALRHPLDTILSCWMQNFKLNPAMANMVDLDRIVEFYCVAMETFQICRAKYNLSVHEIRYEDLLENLSGETSRLLKFLGLDWEPQMENYQATALQRGRINTPSYSQVVQPIYKDAKYRWLNYEKYLRQFNVKVGPWINEFGYSSH